MFDVALRSYFLTIASESKLTIPDEVDKAIRSLKVGNDRAQMVYRTGL
jgi:hypothetical protein